MDRVRLQIPYEFVRDRADLSWNDIHFGLRNELLDNSAPREFAFSQIAASSTPEPALLELATTQDLETTIELVTQLAHRETREADTEKWLYIVLAWLWERKGRIPEPLERVAEVYADFDYPEQISHLVYYMPMTGKDLGSVAANQQRLYAKWKAFVDESAVRFAPTAARDD